MKNPNFAICLVLFAAWGAYAAAQDYSPPFFGPYALPVPEVSDGRIPEHTRAGVALDYSFGGGDRTVGLRLDAEVALLPRRISLKLWHETLEFFTLSPEAVAHRGISPALPRRGYGSGDVYVQTRMSLLGERAQRPSIVLSATLKTASGGDFARRRFYDTPGYWFDVEVGKSFVTHSKAVSEVRIVAQGGFLCWETTGSRQNDAPMYGLGVTLSNRWVSLTGQIGGYSGWIGNHDRPLSFRARFEGKYRMGSVFVQYQRGIVDFPYDQVRVGCSFDIAALTPRWGRGRHRQRVAETE